ncbi:MAG: AI-2E family transporter [Flammeovirgaceae bacterium]|jgi:AI-2 transport protein TqsA|nr:AI-2E family transporter [Flammeovirgaceae bacterium]|tara:strand:+ start:1611 stop:2663 length:1053 start_codon:yes stop_codon:yes gene_type:complete
MERFEVKNSGKYAYPVILTGLVILFLIYFKSLIQPFILALIVWYLIRITREGLNGLSIYKKRLPTWLSGLLSIAITFGIIFIIFIIIQVNINDIIDSAPKYNQNFENLLSNVTALTGISDIDEYLRQKLLTLDLNNFAKMFLSGISNLLSDGTMVLIYLIFLLMEEKLIPLKLQKIKENGLNANTWLAMINKISHSVNLYMGVKVVMSLLTAVLSYFIMIFIGVDFAILWAFLIFILNFIPFVGSLVATLFPSFFAVFQFGEVGPFLWTFCSVFMVQLLVGNLVEPKLMGKTLNMSPLIVIISLSFWGSIWGILGMILSVPMVSILIIILAHFPKTRNIAILFSENGVVT